MKNSKILYSINIKDIQEVSVELINRKLSEKELKIVGRDLGDYINWFDAVENVITQSLKIEVDNE